MNKRIIMIIFITMIFVIFLFQDTVFGTIQSEFNDSTTEKNLTFSGNENKTVYVELPKNTLTLSAYLNLSGYEKCVDCTNCTYSPDSNMNDIWTENSSGIETKHFKYGDWITFEVRGELNTPLNIYIFYPNGSTWYSHLSSTDENGEYSLTIQLPNSNSGRWTWGVGSGHWLFQDFELEYPSSDLQPSDCFCRAPLEGASPGDAPDGGGYYYCIPGSPPDGNYDCSYKPDPPCDCNWLGGTSSCLYNFTTNPYLDVTNDGDVEWSYSGEFNTINEKTSDFSSEINDGLNSGLCDCNGCYLNGNICSIPFLVHSDTPGIIQLSSLSINYNLPPIIELNNPSNGTTDVSTSPLLNITVIDLDGDNMNVTINSTTDSSIIKEWYDVPNGTTLTYQWNAIKVNKTYELYVNVCDSSNSCNYSSWIFTTKENPDSCAELWESREYNLTQDIINSSTSKCMEITANNVTLDCQGHTIDRDDEYEEDYGIYVNSNNVTIKNCTLTDWEGAGIYQNASKDLLLYNLTLYSNDRGIILLKSNNTIIKNINSSNNGDGIYILESTFIINNSIIQNLYFDIFLDIAYCDYCCKSEINNVNGSRNKPIKFYNNSINIKNEDLSELILCDADNSNISNTTILGSQNLKNNALFLIRSDFMNITNVNSSSNYYGIVLYNSSNNKFIDVNISNEGCCNFLINSNNNTFDNVVCSNNVDGIALYDSNNNTIINSFFESNSWYGIELDGYSSNNIIYNSVLKNNTEYSSIGIRNGDNNKIYNCLFNDSKYVEFYGTYIYENYWNTTKQIGTRIYSNGSYIGGNYYTNSTGNGYSDTCSDSDKDGFCDTPYQLGTNNIDWLTLSDEYAGPTINSYQILPRYGYGVNITINANVTSSSSTISWVNFTLTAPNNTNVIDNQNGTNYNADLWNSSYYILDNYGTWTANITAGDIVGYTNSVQWTFNVTLGTFTIKSPDNDDDWTFSLNKTENELFNITLTTDGNSNNTIDFYVTGDLDNSTICNVTFESDPYTLLYNSTKKLWVNITTSATSPNGTYSGYIVANRTNDNTQDNISITFTITSSGAGNVDIIETTFSIAGAKSNTYTKTFTVNNTGSYELTHCNMSLTTYISGSDSWNSSDFNILIGIPKTVKLSFTPSSTGSDSSAVVTCECVATAEGGKDQDSITGAIAITQEAQGGGGGGATKYIKINPELLILDINNTCVSAIMNITWTGPSATAKLVISDEISDMFLYPKSGDTIQLKRWEIVSIPLKVCIPKEFNQEFLQLANATKEQISWIGKIDLEVKYGGIEEKYLIPVTIRKLKISEEKITGINFCGDGICDQPKENWLVCPSDCKKPSFNMFLVVIALIIIALLIYMFIPNK